MEVTRLSAAEVAQKLSREWGLRTRDLAGEAPPDALIADYIRAILSGHAGLDRQRADPVYVTTILNRVNDQLSALWPGTSGEPTGKGDAEHATDPARRVLEAMENLRDCEHVGNGYWLPAPVRLVELSSETALVVGGQPTWQIEDQLGCEIQRRGVTRTVLRDDLLGDWAADDRKWQALSSWEGSPPPDLLQWLKGERRRAEDDLMRSSAELDDFDVYWPPDATRAEAQWFRWIPSTRLSRAPDDLVLCRARGGYFGQRRCWWGALTHGRTGPTLREEAVVEPLKVRRLQYGLDAEYGNPTSVVVDRAQESLVVTLRSAVPPEERRLFTALGRDESDTSGRYPIRLRFPDTHTSVVESTLRSLQVEIIGQHREKR